MLLLPLPLLLLLVRLKLACLIPWRAPPWVTLCNIYHQYTPNVSINIPAPAGSVMGKGWLNNQDVFFQVFLHVSLDVVPMILAFHGMVGDDNTAIEGARICLAIGLGLESDSSLHLDGVYRYL